MKRAGAVVFFAGLVGVAASEACLPSSTACTLVGCSSALTIEAPTLGDGPFTVAIDSASLAGEVDCGALVDGGRGQATAARGDIARDFDAVSTGDVVVVAECTERGVRLLVARSDARATEVLPTTATINVTSGADVFSVNAQAIEYDVSQPNGPECEPTCHTALVVAE
jgi:hypothetical protein